MPTIPLVKRMTAEFLGTAWLIFGGCGSAVLAAKFLTPDNANVNLGIGFVGVALAFGLTVLTMAYAIGHISGCHLNPAVSVGLWAGKRFPASDLLPYIVAQVLGGIVGAGVPVSDCQRAGGVLMPTPGSPPTGTATTRRGTIRWRPVWSPRSC